MATRSMSEHEASATSEGSSSLLASMREMMEEKRGDIIEIFKTIVAYVVKREDMGTLAPLENKITLFASVISNVEEAANDHEQRLASVQGSVDQLQGKVDFLSKKCEKEGRSGLNNIRILGIAEGARGPHPTEFVAGLLQNLLRLGAKYFVA
ncbi:hypothetical protein CRENBAI_013639 [Crenichthys baileyi]|uniref:Uncharacterized protein n=1 Tax=Crenichthys baileyi TaxID=28760 RepID=A0AAV9RS19_9TELE